MYSAHSWLGNGSTGSNFSLECTKNSRSRSRFGQTKQANEPMSDTQQRDFSGAKKTPFAKLNEQSKSILKRLFYMILHYILSASPLCIM